MRVITRSNDAYMDVLFAFNRHPQFLLLPTIPYATVYNLMLSRLEDSVVHLISTAIKLATVHRGYPEIAILKGTVNKI